MPAGEVCLHEACGRTQAQRSVPAIHLQSLKLMQPEIGAQHSAHICFSPEAS